MTAEQTLRSMMIDYRDNILDNPDDYPDLYLLTHAMTFYIDCDDNHCWPFLLAFYEQFATTKDLFCDVAAHFDDEPLDKLANVSHDLPIHTLAPAYRALLRIIADNPTAA